jgi:uncharacterized protein (DUF305 family)
MAGTYRLTTLAIVVALLLAADGILAAGTPVDTPGAAAPAPRSSDPPGTPVIVPGRPGEPAAVVRAGQSPSAPSPRYNSVDAWFVRTMIPHHTQALRMAALAPERAGDPRVRALAERIRVSQAPEVLRMRSWLDARDLSPDTEQHSGHDHEAPFGMPSPDALNSLALARGAAFDRMFVELMVAHHQGAIDMATAVLRGGVDSTVAEIATAVATEQAAEIGRMRELVSG